MVFDEQSLEKPIFLILGAILLLSADTVSALVCYFIALYAVDYIFDLGLIPKGKTVEPYDPRCKKITLAGNRCMKHRSKDSKKGYCAFHENKSR